ncbi:MAG TPA: BTAD domain-containing putative transcriptional regulator [Longimicrobium sp.]|nr:BTAD domain-containing putative transcriptional regulator [Longimicrobium sp.]
MTRGSGTAEIPLSRLAQALLSYLLLNRHRRHPRDVLATLFWGESREERARACLATALWRLRRALGPAGGTGESWIVVAPSGDVTFNGGAPCHVDAAQMEAGVRAALSRPPAALGADETNALEQALELYAGELLEGMYHDWAQRERDRFRNLYHDGAWHLMRALAHRKEWERCAAWGERILRSDPLREDVHRELMRVYATAGRRALSVQQYHRCRDVLRRELGVDPAPETTALLGTLAGPPPAAAAAPPFPPFPSSTGAPAAETGDSREALLRLHHAWVTFESARGELARTIALVEQIVPAGYA